MQIVLKNQEGKVLLLKRSSGNPLHIGQLELPGGTVQEGEQPEDSLRRHLKTDLDLNLSDFKLRDALTIADREDSDLEQVLIVYESDYPTGNPDIKPRGSYDSYEWVDTNELADSNLRDSAASILNVSMSIGSTVEKNNITTRYILFSDGGSRGNPGPSSAAFVLFDNETSQVLEEDGVYLGITTNNQAEYHGLRLGIERAIERGLLVLECRMDSMLVVNQLNGSYHIKNRELWPIFERIRSYVPQFEKITFVHIPREENQKADAMVNRLLDQHQNDTM